jgi:hypothetical protein
VQSLSEAAAHRAADAPAWAVSVFVSALALWIGAAVFFSAGILPVLFTSLAPAEAGGMAALLFPVYFRAGLAAAVVACAAAARIAAAKGGKWKGVVALLLVMTLAQGWSTVVIHPEMAGIRGVEAEVARFQQLHKLSVRLNGVVLVGGLLLLGGSGFLLAGGVSRPALAGRREPA